MDSAPFPLHLNPRSHWGPAFAAPSDGCYSSEQIAIPSIACGIQAEGNRNLAD
jgi:hypothetical protein